MRFRASRLKLTASGCTVYGYNHVHAYTVTLCMRVAITKRKLKSNIKNVLWCPRTCVDSL